MNEIVVKVKIKFAHIQRKHEVKIAELINKYG